MPAARERVWASLQYENGVRALGELFAAASLAPVVVKGQAVSDLGFGRASCRLASDVDLLVLDDEADVARALVEHGYTEAVPPGRPHSLAFLGERVFRPPALGLPHVELHRRLDKLISRPIDYPAIVEASTPSRFPGLRFPTREHLLLLVVLHASCAFGIDTDRVLDDLEAMLQHMSDLGRIRTLAMDWGLAVAFDTWMVRLHERRKEPRPAWVLRSRDWLCRSVWQHTTALPTGIRYFTILAPWHDSQWWVVRDMIGYTFARLRDRLG